MSRKSTLQRHIERQKLGQLYKDGILEVEGIERAYDNKAITKQEFAKYMEFDTFGVTTWEDLSWLERKEFEEYLDARR